MSFKSTYTVHTTYGIKFMIRTRIMPFWNVISLLRYYRQYLAPTTHILKNVTSFLDTENFTRHRVVANCRHRIFQNSMIYTFKSERTFPLSYLVYFLFTFQIRAIILPHPTPVSFTYFVLFQLKNNSVIIMQFKWLLCFLSQKDFAVRTNK